MAIVAKRFEYEFFTTYPYSPLNTKITVSVQDTNESVLDNPAYYEIIERTLPDVTGAGRIIQIVLGQYEEIKELTYESVDDDFVEDMKTLIEDAISSKTDFVYSPDNGTTLYRVFLFGADPFIIGQPRKPGQFINLRLIIKETL